VHPNVSEHRLGVPLNFIHSGLSALHVRHVLRSDDAEWVVRIVECSCLGDWQRCYHWNDAGLDQRSDVSKLFNTLGVDPPLELG
jgi:hypothetical protein